MIIKLNKRGSFYATVSALAVSMVVAVPVSAQVFQDEIIVTAQKRAESVQDVGISVTALSGDQMEALGFSNAQDITNMAPGVSTVQPNNEGSYSIAIRGAANADFVANQEAPVSIYVDEVYISQGAGTGFMLFDLERVEILRGPQGTLFGRNATGGLAHFVTKKPTQEFEGYAKLTVGSFGQFKTEGAISGGLAENVSARISISTHHNSGYLENRFTGEDRDLNNANDFTGRAQLLFEPSDNTSVLLNVRGARQDIRTGGFENVTSINNPSGFGVLTPGGIDFLGYTDPDGNNDVYAGDFDREGFNDLETFGVSGTLKHQFANNMNLTSITDYQTVKRDYIEDSDAGPGDFFNFFVTTDARQFSQEVRLDGENDAFKWVLGAYYLDISNDDSNGAEAGAFAGSGEPAGTIPSIVNPYTVDKESISIFGQVEYDISEQITLIGGLRLIKDKVEIDFISNFATVPVDIAARDIATRRNNTNILAQLGSYQGEYDETLWAARAQVNFTPVNSDNLYYVSYNRGVKGGGFNAPFDVGGTLAVTGRAGLDSTLMDFQEEIVNAFEIGAKLNLGAGIRLNGSAYFNDYENYQSFNIVGLDSRITDSEAKSKGFEIELQASLDGGWDAAFGVGYNDTDIQVPDLLNVAGTAVQLAGYETTPVQSPKWNLNGLVRKAFDLGSGEVAAQLSGTYRSEHFFSLNGGRSGAGNSSTEDGYALFNARVSYSPDNMPVEFSAFVNNLTDEEYLVQTFDLTTDFGFTEQIYGRPRWFGASVKYSFGQ